MNSDYKQCCHKTEPSLLVTYDIGHDSTEQILVCDNCYNDETDDCFRCFEISKVDVTNNIKNNARSEK
jgi:hypothetical protein